MGEANVVQLAERLREQGIIVPILGEGSNGGNITHPSRVRYPISTVFAFLKLLLIEGDSKTPGLFEIWCRKSRTKTSSIPRISLAEILDTLPSYSTTPISDARAILKIKTSDHGVLKARCEKLFSREWSEKKDWLEKELSFVSWEEVNYEGTQTRVGFVKQFRTGEERGGLKILFKDKDGAAVGFIWMRGSGTEPVFRILADVQGENKEGEKKLLAWHKEMVIKADREIG